MANAVQEQEGNKLVGKAEECDCGSAKASEKDACRQIVRKPDALDFRTFPWEVQFFPC